MTKNLEGILWNMGSVALFSVMTVSVRYLAAKYPVMELVFIRTVMVLAVLGPWMLRGGVGNIRTTRMPLYLFRVVLAYGGVLGWFYGVAHIVLADAVALHFTLPLFGVVFAILILKERVDAHRWAALAVGFAGMLIILRPGFAEIQWVALAVLGSAACYAISNITVKLLSNTEPPTRIVFYLNFLLLPVSAVPVLFDWVPLALEDWPLLLAMGLSTLAAHLCLTRAYAVGEASVLFPIEFLRLPIAAAAGIWLFAETPSHWTGLGALIIFGATYYITRRERSGAASAA